MVKRMSLNVTYVTRTLPVVKFVVKEEFPYLIVVIRAHKSNNY